MTDHRFDDLTKALGKHASRRALLKGLAAAAIGGVFLRAGGDDAEATRARRACSRLGQACGGANAACCPDLACGDDAVCCVPNDGNCIEDADCCGDNVCRPNPDGLGARCLPPGDLGVACLEPADCAGGLDCQAGVCCLTENADCVDASDCCGDLVCAPDIVLGTVGETYCVQCRADMEACTDDRQCCGGTCDPYTGTCFTSIICGGPAATCDEVTPCCAPFTCVGGTCQFVLPCGSSGLPCAPFGCCAGLTCDINSFTCVGAG